MLLVVLPAQVLTPRTTARPMTAKLPTSPQARHFPNRSVGSSWRLIRDMHTSACKVITDGELACQETKSHTYRSPWAVNQDAGVVWQDGIGFRRTLFGSSPLSGAKGHLPATKDIQPMYHVEIVVVCCIVLPGLRLGARSSAQCATLNRIMLK